MGDELRLTEDLQLDSLGRVQLAAALEERLGIAPESGLLEQVQTLGELRAAGGRRRTKGARDVASASAHGKNAARIFGDCERQWIGWEPLQREPAAVAAPQADARAAHVHLSALAVAAALPMAARSLY